MIEGDTCYEIVYLYIMLWQAVKSRTLNSVLAKVARIEVSENVAWRFTSDGKCFSVTYISYICVWETQSEVEAPGKGHQVEHLPRSTQFHENLSSAPRWPVPPPFRIPAGVKAFESEQLSGWAERAPIWLYSLGTHQITAAQWGGWRKVSLCNPASSVTLG